MNRKMLSDAVGNIDMKYILEADDRKIHLSDFRRFGRPGHHLRNTAAACIAFVLCFSLMLSVLAANVDPIYQILYTVNQTIAQSLKPVRMSCESNGIRMEVISADIEGNTASVYMSMKDLEGDRIDQTIDLFDSYDIHLMADQTGTCSFESYDEETGTAVFLIHISTMDGTGIPEGKVTFSVGEFLSHKTTTEGPVQGIDLSEASEHPATRTEVNIRGGSGEAAGVFLLSEEQPLGSPADGVQVTAMGFVDNRLHVQLYFENILQYDNHGWITLTNAGGESLDPVSNESFWDEDHAGSYEEYVFDVSPDEIKDYTLEGYFRTCDTRVQGDWQVTFSLENTGDKDF